MPGIFFQSVGYLQENAGDIARTLSERGEPLIIPRDGEAKAEYVLGQIENAFDRLAVFPFRGVIPSESAETGVVDYREVFFKPYRIFYLPEDLIRQNYGGSAREPYGVNKKTRCTFLKGFLFE